MTKFDWNEMKRAKMERQEKEQEFKNLVGFAFQVCGGFAVFYTFVAVFG